MGKLDGKVVIVTGASRGIGADIARLFAAEGGKVIAAARTLREGDHPLEGSLEHTVGQIKEAGGEATAVAVDISKPEECDKLVQSARETYGPVDVLVRFRGDGDAAELLVGTGEVDPRGRLSIDGTPRRSRAARLLEAVREPLLDVGSRLTRAVEGPRRGVTAAIASRRRDIGERRRRRARSKGSPDT